MLTEVSTRPKIANFDRSLIDRIRWNLFDYCGTLQLIMQFHIYIAQLLK